MKINISIKADSNVTYYCGGWLVSNEPLLVKLGNPAIANLVSGPLPCCVEIPGKASLMGNIRRSGRDNCFVVNK